MKPIVKTIDGATAPVANSIAESQSLPGAGNLTLDGALCVGGVAYLSPNESITITSAGDDSGITFTIVGKDRYGNTQTETWEGPNAGAYESDLFYSEVTQISASGATAGNVTVGNAGITVSEMVLLDAYAQSDTIYQVSPLAGASLTWALQGTLDNPNDPVSPVSTPDMVWHATTLSAMVSASNSQLQQGNWTPLYVRLRIDGTGQIRFTAIQRSN